MSDTSSDSSSSSSSSNPKKDGKKKEEGEGKHGQNKKTTDDVMKEMHNMIMRLSALLAVVVVADLIMNLASGATAQVLALFIATGASLIVPVIGYLGAKWADDIMLGAFALFTFVQTLGYLMLFLQASGAVNLENNGPEKLEEAEDLSTTTTTAQPVEELDDTTRVIHIIFLGTMTAVAAAAFWNGYGLFRSVQKMNAGTLAQYHTSRGSLVMARVSEMAKRTSRASRNSVGSNRSSVGSKV